jgi:tetratricopeptide (TPR) repeat protein
LPRVLACMLVGVLFHTVPSAAQDRPGRPPPLTAIEVAGWREDLRVLAAEMPARHRNLFHTLRRAEFEGAVRRLEARLPTLRRHQVILELARIAARIGDGHTNVAPARDAAIGFHALPLRLYLFADGLYVRAADSAHANLVGSRVIRLGRATAEEAVEAVRPLIARDNEMGVAFAAPLLLAMPEVLAGLGLIEDMGEVPLVLERDGRRTDVVLAPDGLAPLMARDTDRSWEVPEGWVDARGAPDRWPLWLRQPGNKFWLEYLEAERAVYVQLNEVGDKPEETVAGFADSLATLVRAHPVDRLVLDLRLNGGGNGALTRALVLALVRAEPLRARGHLFVLIGRRTFSAAQFLATELERWTEAIFVGEPTASRGNHYGDSYRIRLPRSGITVRVSTLYWQLSDPRDARPWTPPEIAVGLTFDDYRGNRDPVLAAALAWTPEPALAERMRSALESDGRDGMDSAYRSFRADPRHRYAGTEDPLNALGYALLQERRPADALAVFTLNTEAYPTSANAHDSRGEALAATGDTSAAIRAYETAVRLDPALPGAADKLRALRRRRPGALPVTPPGPPPARSAPGTVPPPP